MHHLPDDTMLIPAQQAAHILAAVSTEVLRAGSTTRARAGQVVDMAGFGVVGKTLGKVCLRREWLAMHCSTVVGYACSQVQSTAQRQPTAGEGGGEAW